ncbi:MAG: 50S ribosomal protein L21 [Parcubacteria group bacterium]
MDRIAIVKIGGKQYLARKGGRIMVDRMAGKEGSTLTLSEVLLVTNGKETEVGTPTLKGIKITARIVGHPRGPKGWAFRYARKKRVRRLKGYRAALTELEVINL